MTTVSSAHLLIPTFATIAGVLLTMMETRDALKLLIAAIAGAMLSFTLFPLVGQGYVFGAGVAVCFVVGTGLELWCPTEIDQKTRRRLL